MKSFACSAVVVLAGLSIAESADACPTRLGSASAAVNDGISTYRTKTKGMCIGAIANGVVSKQCVGNRIKAIPSPVTTSSLFLIHTITATMTATLFALRASQPSSPVGLLSSLNDFMPPFAPVPTSIKLLSLATHHSGLPQTLPTQVSTESDFFAEVSSCTHTSCWDSSQDFLYSNLGFQVLGDVIADTDGAAGFAADAQNAVLGPLGMTRTKSIFQFTTFFNSDFAANYTIGTLPDGQGGWFEPLFPVETPAFEVAGGGFYSSLDDMMRWLDFNMGNSGPADLHGLLPTIRNPWEPRDATSDQALAWTIDDDSCEASGLHYAKEGAGIGFNSYIVYDHHAQRGVVVLLDVDSDILAANAVALRVFHELP